MPLETIMGLLIKKHRQAVGLSLRELARKSNLTASFLSQVEHNKTNVSLDSLRRIAEALGISMLELIPKELNQSAIPAGNDRPDGLPSVIEPYSPVMRYNMRPKLILTGSGLAYQLLTPDLNHKMEAVCGSISPGTDTENVARRLREPTEEFIYVLSGALLVELDIGEYVLYPGDTIYFDGWSLRKLASASQDEETRWLSVFTPSVF